MNSCRVPAAPHRVQFPWDTKRLAPVPPAASSLPVCSQIPAESPSKNTQQLPCARCSPRASEEPLSPTPRWSVGHCGMATPVSPPSTRPLSQACGTTELFLGAPVRHVILFSASHACRAPGSAHGVRVGHTWCLCLTALAEQWQLRSAWLVAFEVGFSFIPDKLL